MVPSSAAHVPPNYPCLEPVSRVSGQQEPLDPWKAFPTSGSAGGGHGVGRIHRQILAEKILLGQ